MIVDFDSLEPNRPFECDICIVGSGACGTSIGLEFLQSPHKVIILESGGVKEDSSTADLHRSFWSGLPLPGAHKGRARVHGGTTTLWGGQALELFPIDFEKRSWVAQSGWPLSSSELQNYYRRAAAVLRVDGAPYDESRSAILRAPPLDFSDDTIERVYSQWSPQPNFAEAYRSKFSRSTNVDVLLRANVVDILANSGVNAVAEIKIKSLSGRSSSVRARYFVLCAGGIETARLLLSARSAESNGLGNRHDLVGRSFQDHVAITCGPIHANSRERLQDLFEQYYRGGVKFLPKLRATDELQKERKILNVIGNICFAWPSESKVAEAKRVAGALLRGQRSANFGTSALQAIGGLIHLGPIAWRRFVRRRSYTPASGRIYLEAHCEQEPDAECRVTLSEEKDALGMPRTNIHWQPSEMTWRSITTFAEAAAKELARLGIGRIELTLPDQTDSEAWNGVVSDMFHHMGTTRMSEDPRQGVVDRTCRVHGLENLYVGSSAVFPTGGCSSPTLTAIALSIRIADLLSMKLRKTG